MKPLAEDFRHIMSGCSFAHILGETGNRAYQQASSKLLVPQMTVTILHWLVKNRVDKQVHR
jgi:hypothetical protein